MTEQQQAALKLALEALESWVPVICEREITALRQALEQRCVCGEPDTPGTHRTDGPCYAEQPEQQEPVDSSEKAGAYMEARLWEFIDMAATWPEASPDQRTWDHVMVYAPKPAQQEPAATIFEGVVAKWNLPATFTGVLYTRPQAREPLTDEQILRLVPGLQDCLCDPYDYNNSGNDYASIPKDMIRLARAIEAAHGIGEKK